MTGRRTGMTAMGAKRQRMDSSQAQNDSHESRKAKKEIPASAGMTNRRTGMTAMGEERKRTGFLTSFGMTAEVAGMTAMGTGITDERVGMLVLLISVK